MPAGKGTYGKKRGRPPGKCKNAVNLEKTVNVENIN